MLYESKVIDMHDDEAVKRELMDFVADNGVTLVGGPKSAEDPHQMLADVLQQALDYSPERERREAEYMFGPIPRKRPKKSTGVVKQRKANKAARVARKRK